MTPRTAKRPRTPDRDGGLQVKHPHAAGIDVHAATHFVAVPPEDVPAGFVNPEPRLPAGVRKFGSNTGDLEALAALSKETKSYVHTQALTALRSLGRDGEKVLVPVLVDMLKEPTQRSQAAMHLANLSPEVARQAAPALKDLLADAQPNTRLQAAQSLLRLGGDEGKAAVPVLAELLKSAQPGIQDLRQQIVDRPSQELGVGPERAVRAEGRERVDLQEVDTSVVRALEVGTREVAALERREGQASEPHQLGLERGIERARHAMRDLSGRGTVGGSFPRLGLDGVQADARGRLERALEHR